jgi:hypothetical protein
VESDREFPAGSDTDSYLECEDASSLYDEDDDLSQFDQCTFVNLPKQAEEQSKEEVFRRNLADWVVSNRVKHIHATKLLKLLHEFIPFLPLDVRTLLKSMRTVSTKNIHPGQYHYFGIVNGVKKSLSICKLSSLPDQIGVFVNVDGIPLTESTKHVFWPIVAKIAHPFQGRPFTIGIYYGRSEPEDFNSYIHDFVEEAKFLRRQGIEFCGKSVKVNILGFICDAPARAKITYTVPHNAYFGCSKCVIKGEYFKIPGSTKGRVTFPNLDCELRTDQSFRMRAQPEHHLLNVSKLEELPINMVLDIPDEEMHLLDLGCIRKMLHFMTKGRGTAARLSSRQVKEISDRLAALGPHVPCDFARKPRTLLELKLWKATELHFFLMYAGVVVLKNIIPEPLYVHYLILHSEVRILSNATLFSREGVNEYCTELLKRFVEESIELYGQQFVSFNIHNLIHMPASVNHWRTFGPLYANSAYPFENHLQMIKSLVVAK